MQSGHGRYEFAAVGYYATTPDLGLGARYSSRSIQSNLFSTRLFFRLALEPDLENESRIIISCLVFDIHSPS